MGYLLYNGKAVTGDSMEDAAIVIDGKKIRKIIKGDEWSEKILEEYPDFHKINLEGKLVFAGGIDAHVHFREPGLTHKADMESESKAAVEGGVTSFIDMPNTKPATTSAESLSEKLGMASGRCHANYGFHLGATNDNFKEIEEILKKGKNGISAEDFGGIKVFMGSSTGNMLVDDSRTLEAIFNIKEKEILVHCEDEKTIKENLLAAQEEYGDRIPFRKHCDIRSRRACILSSVKALELAMKYGTRLHLLHVSTKEETEMVRAAKLSNGNITAETSANYLWFTDRQYERLGSRIKCNPAIKTEEDRNTLIKALKEGIIDTVGSDHAPHLAEEKDRDYISSPSGVPSIQQSLPVLLTVAEENDIPLTRIASVFSEKVSRMFGIRDRGCLKAGYYADLAIVDMESEHEITGKDISYKCGWSPYEGERLRGKITDVFVNGIHVVTNGKLSSSGHYGEQLKFEK